MHYVILGLLILHGPLSPYAVQRAFTQEVSLFCSASFGGIQRALRQLAERGLVVVAANPAGVRGSKPYEITDAGIVEWRAWMGTPIEGSDVETTALSKTFFLGLLEPLDREIALETIRTRIADDLAGLHAAARSLDAADVPPHAADVFAYQRATLDYGIRAHELAREWFDTLSSRGSADPGVRG